jgi:trehalose-phosphatase
VPREWQHLVSAPQLVVALDLDGTLIPFAPTPHEARVDGDAAQLIADLSALPGVTVGVVTGRPRDLVEDLPARFPRVLYAAEHGVWRWDGSWQAALPAIKELGEIEGSLRALAARHPGAIVERKSCSVCLHWRSVAPVDQDLVSAAAEVIVDEWLETHGKLERLPVIEALEVRHRGAHKGTAISWLRSKGPAGAPLLAVGDDITDEDMFVSLRDGDVGILVSEQPRRTQAGLRLPSITSVHKFLRWLIDARRQQPTIAPAEAAETYHLQSASHPALPTEARLVVASNRLPAAPTSARGREVGGLVSALVPALTQTSGLWYGA